MQFIENYWWLWTIGVAIVCLYEIYEFCAVFNNVMELKQPRRWYSIIIAVVLYIVFMNLLVISVVLNMIRYVKEGL